MTDLATSALESFTSQTPEKNPSNLGQSGTFGDIDPTAQSPRDMRPAMNANRATETISRYETTEFPDPRLGDLGVPGGSRCISLATPPNLADKQLDSFEGSKGSKCP
jgi:hypothetical protein